MARLIDADALKEKYTMVTKRYSGGIMECPAVLLESIDSAPTIDAVSVVGELVRCEECKYEAICSHSVQHTTHELTSVTIGYKSVNYCSCGERREP